MLGARLLHQPAQRQRAHDRVAVDAADRRHPRPADRLPVGDHGQGLQRRLGEAHLLAVAHEPLHHRRALLARVEPPPPGHVAQVEQDLLRALLLQLLQARLHVGRLAVREAVHLDDAYAPRLHARLGRRNLRRAAPHAHDERPRPGAQNSQLDLAARGAVKQLPRVVQGDVARRLAVNVLDDVARL